MLLNKEQLQKYIDKKALFPEEIDTNKVWEAIQNGTDKTVFEMINDQNFHYEDNLNF